MGSLKLPKWFLLAYQTHWDAAPTSALPARSTCGSPRDCFRGPVPSCWSPALRRSGFRCARVCSSRALWLGHGSHGPPDRGHFFKRHAFWGRFKVLTRTKQIIEGFIYLWVLWHLVWTTPIVGIPRELKFELKHGDFYQFQECIVHNYPRRFARRSGILGLVPNHVVLNLSHTQPVL